MGVFVSVDVGKASECVRRFVEVKRAENAAGRLIIVGYIEIAPHCKWCARFGRDAVSIAAPRER